MQSVNIKTLYEVLKYTIKHIFNQLKYEISVTDLNTIISLD